MNITAEKIMESIENNRSKNKPTNIITEIYHSNHVKGVGTTWLKETIEKWATLTSHLFGKYGYCEDNSSACEIAEELGLDISRTTPYLDEYTKKDFYITSFWANHRVSSLKKNGVDYIPAALYGKCDTSIYRAWEDLFFPTEDGKRNCWDGECVWGASPQMIDRVFFLSGCKKSNKFFLILKILRRILEKEGRMDDTARSFLRRVKKSHSVDNVKDLYSAVSFFMKKETEFLYFELSSKDMIKFGRLSYPLKCFFVNQVYEYTSSAKGERVKINWGYYSKWRTLSKAQKSEYLSPKDAWYFLFGRCPFEVMDNIPHPSPLAKGKRLSCFIQLYKNCEDRSECLLPCFNISCLFGSYNEALKFLGDDLSYLNIHDKGQFQLPSEDCDIQFWKGFVFKNPTALEYSAMFGKIDREFGMPKSISQLREWAGMFSYEGAKHHPEIAAICSKFNLGQNDFDTYVRVSNTSKKAESCPDITFEKAGYKLSKLPSSDVRGLFLGHYTNCCQHLTGAGASCAIHGYIDPTSAFYIVEYKGEIIAQSWAWRSKESDLVFDSIEGLGGYENDIISDLFISAAKGLTGKLGINRVLVGNTSYGLTSNLFRDIDRGKIYNVKMRSKCSYIDGETQFLLYSIGKGAKFKKKQTTTPDKGSVLNIEQQGSNVFCEHCETEVHYSAEICPNCNRDISEWV